MEFFFQFFATPRDVVRAYMALDNTRLKEIAEERLGCQIIKIEEFCSEEFNVFILGDICMLHCNNCIYVYDEYNNYIKLCSEDGGLRLVETYIQNIYGYNFLWDTVHNVFLELCAGDIHIEKTGCTTYILLGKCNNRWALVDIDGIGIYDGKSFTTPAKS